MTNQFGSLAPGHVRRAAAVAADYKVLQGAAGVAVGLGLALFALGRPGYGLVVMVVGGLASDAWYRRHFGRARSRADLLPTVLMVGAALVVYPVSYRIDSAFGAPLLALPIAAALLAAAGYRFAYPHVGATRAHWVVVVLLALCSLLPLLGIPASSGPTAGVLALATAMVTIGVIDHLRLVSAMAPAAHE